MKDNLKTIIKSFGARFSVKAIQTFDRATMVVVCSCWSAALLMIVFAIYTLSLSASTRRAAETAAASEPILPIISRKPIDKSDARPLMEHMQHRYPEISFSLGSDQAIAISASEGSKFREWLTVLSYVDVLSPKYRWTIKELCVGKCGNGGLMRAVLTGESIDFRQPPPKKNK